MSDFSDEHDLGSEAGSDFDSVELPSEEEEDMFLDDSMHEGDLEPTDVSESLHISDLEQDAFPDSIEPVPEPVLPPVVEDEGQGGLFGAALKVGVLGSVLLATKRFGDLLNNDDDDNEAAAEMIYRMQDSMGSQSSSNVAGAGPV